MQYCSKCVMPDTRPGSIFTNGICQACLNYEKRKGIDWDKKYNELERICNFYRGTGKPHDVAIPVSGGKDSHFLVYLAKKLNMTPLLVRIADGFTITKAGKHNIRNLSERFGCDIIEYTPSINTYRRMTRICFEELGSLPFIDTSIYNTSMDIISRLGIQLVFLGEDPLYEYGTTTEQLPDLEVLSKIMSGYDGDFWQKHGFPEHEIAFLQPPSVARRSNFFISPIFMSHYISWSGAKNYEIALEHGFQDLGNEWIRTCDPTSYDSIDCIGWAMSHIWKWQKFGYGRGTDLASRWIREGSITRKQGIEIAKKYDGVIDQRVFADFLDFAGYSAEEYFEIADKWYNPELFECIRGVWRPKFKIVEKPA